MDRNILIYSIVVIFICFWTKMFSRIIAKRAGFEDLVML